MTQTSLLMLLPEGQFIQAVLAKVRPAVVGTADGLEGQRGLLFVEQHLKEHILIFGMAAIEDELQVTAHREHTGAPPTLFLQFVEIISLKIEAVDTDQTNEGQQHRLMAKAQLGTRMFELDAAVGIGNQLAQQEALTIGLPSAVELAGTVLDIPEGIVDLPHQVEFIGVKKGHQIGALIIVDVQLEEAHLHEIVAELLFIDHLFHDIGILKDELHQTGVTQAGSDIGLVSFLRLGSHITAQLTVLMVHVPLVTLGGLHGDLQLGTHLEHLHQARSHRLDTTRHYRADATHLGAWAQYLRETFRHALTDLLKLSLANPREFTPTALGVLHDDIHLVEHFLSYGCQFFETVGLLHHHIRDIVAAAAADITRSMTSIVGDIEGLLAFGRRCERRGDTVRIHVVVARGIRRGLLNQLYHLGLRP